MSKIKNGELCLSGDETKYFIELMLKPKKDVLMKRNEFFKRINKMKFSKDTNGITIIEDFDKR